MGVTWYTTTEIVAGLLQVPVFNETTIPEREAVEDSINEAEDEIDRVTNHAWREKTITQEMHNLEDSGYRAYTGVPLFLHHRKIKTLDNQKGDLIEIWDGSSWVDYITTYQEGRDKDFWLDYEQGVIFIRTRPPFLPKVFIARITYRYGESSVPKDIEKAATIMAAQDLLMSDDRSVLLPEGTSNITLSEKRHLWDEEIEKILNRYKETVVAIL